MKITPSLSTYLRRVTYLAVLASLGVLIFSVVKEVQTPVAARHG